MKDQLLQANGFMPWEQNPECFKINKRAPHGDIIPYYSLDAALNRRKGERDVTDLNGTWKFLWFGNPDACDAAFPEGLCQVMDPTNWGSIKVPANWQLEGYDYPQYVNAKYPWEMIEDLIPPEIPREFNPVGLYCRSFEIRKQEGMKQILRFEGIESCGEIYVNGRFVGYTEGSFNQSEFDLTEYVTDGENQLVVRVLRWCDGSWLEDQDFFRLSGIFRDVYLYTLPEKHISDYRIDALLDADYCGGLLNIEVNVDGCEDGDAEVTAALYTSCGKPVLEPVSVKVVDGTASFALKVEAPAPWSAETPILYTVVMTLRSAGTESTVSCRTGFRTFEMKDGIMHINGRRIVFKGTNRHEFGAEFGRAITREAMLADVISMKRNNINAVRTSHYPNHPEWYDLCDEYGLYVIDETNLETHGTWVFGDALDKELAPLPGNNPHWTAAVVDRVSDMYYRDRNHASILIWSLGNESYCGENFRAMAGFLREHDQTRLVHYEGERNCPGFEDVTDMISTMYTPVEKWIRYAESDPEKPAILCEYAHAMGNSLGSIVKYTEAFEKYPKLQGGFIWDYVDQAILTRDENGKEYLGYGGDFNEGYHDGNFSGNGLMFADRTETSKMKETKVCYQNIRFESADWKTGTVTLRNRSLFTDLDTYDYKWNLYIGEKKAAAGELAISGAPGETVTIALPLTEVLEKGGCAEGQEAFLNLFAVLKEDTIWAKAGHIVAQGQFCLQNKMADIAQFEAKKQAAAEAGALSVLENYAAIIVRGSDFEYRFSKRSGAFYSICRNGREYLKEPVDCNFWRASTDNDRGSKQSYRSMVWRYAGANASKWVTGTRQEESFVEIPMMYIPPVPTMEKTTVSQWETDRKMPSQAILYSNVRIYGDGTILFDNKWSGGAGLPDIPEIGMMFTLPAGFDRFSWHGRGEHENYIDRKESAFVGTYSSKAADRMVPYLKPQECGNMLDVRRLTLVNQEGGSLTFLGLPTVEANVLPYHPEEMETAMHHKDLAPADKTVVRINYRQTGVGGDDTWSLNARAHEEFRIHAADDVSFAFAVKPE